jgi:tellurite resistance protein
LNVSYSICGKFPSGLHKAIFSITFALELQEIQKAFSMAKLSHHQVLIHIMVTMSAADTNMTDQELLKIETIIKYLPIFADYDENNLNEDVSLCREILDEDNGLETIIENTLQYLPRKLHETAYALAVEVAAADLNVEQEELRLLQIMRQDLDIDKLICSAIERGARARHSRI